MEHLTRPIVNHENKRIELMVDENMLAALVVDNSVIFKANANEAKVLIKALNLALQALANNVPQQ